MIRLGCLLRADTDNLQRLARWLSLPFLGLTHVELARSIEQAVNSPTCVQGGPARISRLPQRKQQKSEHRY